MSTTRDPIGRTRHHSGPFHAPLSASRLPNSAHSSPLAESILLARPALSSQGQPLDSSARTFVQPRFGHDFSRVRVHTDGESAAMAEAMNARAFTVGQNIFFGDNGYRPGSPEGMELLAHELAHTVQQRGLEGRAQLRRAGAVESESDSLEQEADRAAAAVVSGGDAQVSRFAQVLAPQRQPKGQPSQAKTPKIVAPVVPNKAQTKMIDEARRAAAIRAQIAKFKASGVQGAGDFMDARRLAQMKFDWANPNMDQISEILSGIGGGLITVDVKVAGAGDPECGSRAGYVRDHRPPIVLCGGFFADPKNNEGRIRTMIHEMAHVKGIGKADVAEQYFQIFDCDSKGAFESADSWANYVHCLSGQPADKPEEIVGRKGGGKSGTSAPKNKGAGK